MITRGPTGVLLMTYGSPASLDDVGRYLTSVRGGRAPGDELVVEFTRRYAVIGGSPLIGITVEQAAALERLLRERHGLDAVVRAAMRFSAPSIADGLEAMMDRDVREVVGIVLSPQYSPLLMGGYARDVEAARAELGARAPAVTIADPWYGQAAFLDALAARVTEALATFPIDERARVPVLLTAHSLPKRVAETEPAYLAQLEATAQAVAARAGLDRDRWTFCWQSAGHEPGEWMKPDFADLMPALRAEGRRAVVVAPVQFLADHLEILYDIDIGAREQAETAGLGFARIRSLNADPGLIDAFASVVLETLAGARRSDPSTPRP